MMMSWRKEYGIELLDIIEREPRRVPSYYIKQFGANRTAFLRMQDLEEDGLIETYEEPVYGKRTVTVTDKGRTVLEHYWKIMVVYAEADQ